ncbi:MAG: phosphoesterase [Motilibacteraceae bacterium]
MHVTRQRLTPTRGRRRTQVLAGAATVAVAVAGTGVAAAATDRFGTHRVGDSTGQGLLLPSNQNIKPIGDRLLVDNGKLLASTVSPDGRYLAALTNDRAIALTIIDLQQHKILQQAGTSGDADLKISSNNVGQEGPFYTPDGTFLWMPQVNGFDRFPVNADGTVGAPTFLSLPKQGSKSALPTGVAFSADGTVAYVALNGQNQVAKLDAATGEVLARYDVGNAPRQVRLVGGKLYVSDEAGRPAQPGDPTLNSYGTQVVADQTTGATTTGTVSVVDVDDASAPVRTIDVGLHPTALLAHGNVLFVTNTGSDTVSVIDTTKDEVVQTIDTQPWQGSTVGYAPNALALTPDGRLLVSLGRANALAVYSYTSPQEPVSYLGLLPTDYYPEEIALVGGKVVVTNLRGIGARGPQATISKGPGTEPATGYNTHDSTGTLTSFSMPSDALLKRYTAQVWQQNDWGHGATPAEGKKSEKPVPVPLHLGDPSTIKHVFLIVKENRTYDQVLGDDPRGNGDASLAQFGQQVTPNTHALAKQFGLFDNTYDVGTNSAEGHNWVMEADDPEYVESQAGEYERSYDSEDDALGHQRSGFLWTGVQAAGKTVRDFGEYHQFLDKPKGAHWSDFYCDSRNMEATGADPVLTVRSSSPIPSLNSVSVPGYPKFDTDIPDQYRFDIWKRDFEKNGPANLNMMWLMDDHTGGGTSPNPIAQVADNDLAVGKIVDEISHSQYWKDTAIFVVEDDTQNGVDHVDGGRGPVEIISPWARHGVVDSHYYTQINMVRTIEQILGMAPMNQKDSAAEPMRNAFTDAADFTPFTAQPNQVPLTFGLKTAPSCGEDTPATTAALPSLTVPASEKAVHAQWMAWQEQQQFGGANAAPDRANAAQMDRFTWYQTHGWATPYPGDPRIFAPSEVPGRTLPSNENDG